MRILIANDDGIQAPGLRVLERAARALSNDVWVVAPESEQSATSHSLTLHQPLRVRRLSPRRFAVAVIAGISCLFYTVLLFFAVAVIVCPSWTQATVDGAAAMSSSQGLLPVSADLAGTISQIVIERLNKEVVAAVRDVTTAILEQQKRAAIHRAGQKLADLSPAELADIGGMHPKILAEHTVLVGIRNLDDREKEAVRRSGVHVFTIKDIDRQGSAAVIEQALVLAGRNTAGVHVSFDMDVCDPSVAPGVGTPVKGGLNYREAHLVMEMVADSGLLTSLDMVEVNPTLDVRNATAQLGSELALSALGMKIL